MFLFTFLIYIIFYENEINYSTKYMRLTNLYYAVSCR